MPKADPPAPQLVRRDPVGWALGQLTRQAGVPLAFAKPAEAASLLRPDAGRTGRRKRCRAKLASWLAKLHALRGAGYGWHEIRAWTGRRFEADHEHERRRPGV